MSVASIQYIRISDSSSNSAASRFSTSKRTLVTIRSSQADGPLRRPTIATPPVRPSIPPNPPPFASPPVDPAKPLPETRAAGQNVITMEFQRQKAKELQEYFKQKKIGEADQGPFFGFIGKNEIANGRLFSENPNI